MAIDYGRKRCGVAVTDVLKISANGLPTVPTYKLMDFLKDYCSRECVEALVIGEPKTMEGTPSESTRFITPFLNRLKKEMPDMPVIRFDERFTSVLAHKAMIEGGLKKSRRQCKELADEMAAVIILTSYLESRQGRDSFPPMPSSGNDN